MAIADGGILAPGDTVGTLTVGSISLSNASLLNYELGTPGVIGSGVNDLISVSGDLTLDGILNTTALTGFGPGGYRLFDFGGALTDNTLDIGTVPSGFVASNFIIVTGVPNEVDLLVLAGPSAPAVQFWDGSDFEGNGRIDGGMGNWDNFGTNWTDAAGAHQFLLAERRGGFRGHCRNCHCDPADFLYRSGIHDWRISNRPRSRGKSELDWFAHYHDRHRYYHDHCDARRCGWNYQRWSRYVGLERCEHLFG